jgi:hypothetical protein
VETCGEGYYNREILYGRGFENGDQSKVIRFVLRGDRNCAKVILFVMD